ncbi:metallophosphoesterase family protein [bacterium]|nr:MAG: metallophosphoesterase family protein [bacterium]
MSGTNLIGVLSDTHNHTANLRKALEIFERRGVSTLIHCGDVTTLATLEWLADFRVIYVYGNGDYTSGEMREMLLRYHPENYAGLTFGGDLQGVSIAAAHGHIPGSIETMARSGEYDYVFHGHTHRRRDERIGRARVINPGALGGLHREERSVCLVDLASGQVEFVLLPE